MSYFIGTLIFKHVKTTLKCIGVRQLHYSMYQFAFVGIIKLWCPFTLFEKIPLLLLENSKLLCEVFDPHENISYMDLLTASKKICKVCIKIKGKILFIVLL